MLRTCSVRAPYVLRLKYVLRTCSVCAPHVLLKFSDPKFPRNGSNIGPKPEP